MLEKTLDLLKRARVDLSTEKAAQREIYELLQDHDLLYVREYRFDSKSIVDLFAVNEGIAIEVKINKGAAKSIYKQCLRYSMFDEVKTLVLVTNRPMGFPPELNNKPCYVVSLGRGWL